MQTLNPPTSKEKHNVKMLNLIALSIVLLATPSYAAEETIIANANLNAAAKYGPEPLRKLIAAHEQAFPGGFPHRDIFYMPFLDHMSYLQGELVRKLMSIPKYREDLADRGPMLDITIRATKDYEVLAKLFNRSALDRFQLDLTDVVKELTLGKFQKRIAKLVAENYPAYQEKTKSSRYRSPVELFMVMQVFAHGLTKKGSDLDGLKNINLEEGHIDYLQEEELWREALQPTADRLKENHRATFWRNAEEVMKQWNARLRNEEYSDRPKASLVKAGDILHVYEVHPDLATLRGFVGNDCSTDVSFGFPYSPFERVYYVANEKKEFLGYVSLSLVDFRGTRSLFFHTIAGPHINHAMNDMIIRGMNAAREKIGGKYMVMPEDYRIEENINFSPIEQMMKRFAAPAKLEPVTWLDAMYRRVIVDTGSRSFYDDPERNRLGRIIETHSEDLEVTVTEKPFSSPFGLLVQENCAGRIATGGESSN